MLLFCVYAIGWLVDESGQYAAPFVICGSIQAASGLLLLSLALFRLLRARSCCATERTV